MTICIGLQTSDGTVVAADAQESDQYYKRAQQKILPFVGGIPMGNSPEPPSHRVMASSAELMAGNLEFAWLGKGKGCFRDRPRHSFEAVVSAKKAQHVHGIGAGNSKRDGNTRAGTTMH